MIPGQHTDNHLLPPSQALTINPVGRERNDQAMSTERYEVSNERHNPSLTSPMPEVKDKTYIRGTKTVTGTKMSHLWNKTIPPRTPP